jgi:hypothetical protein
MPYLAMPLSILLRFDKYKIFPNMQFYFKPISILLLRFIT